MDPGKKGRVEGGVTDRFLVFGLPVFLAPLIARVVLVPNVRTLPRFLLLLCNLVLDITHIIHDNGYHGKLMQYT